MELKLLRRLLNAAKFEWSWVDFVDPLEESDSFIPFLFQDTHTADMKNLTSKEMADIRATLYKYRFV